MNKEVEKILNDGGIDVKEWFERTTGSEALLMRLLKKFLSDPNFGAIIENIEAGKIEETRKAMHAFEGLSGNLSMIGLYNATLRAHENLKRGKLPETNEVDEAKVLYQNVCSAIQKAETIYSGLSV